MEEIPVGLATRVTAVVGAGFALVAAVTAVLNGDHSQETITFAVLSALSFFVLAGGRYAQAALGRLARLLGTDPVADPLPPPSVSGPAAIRLDNTGNYTSASVSGNTISNVEWREEDPDDKQIVTELGVDALEPQDYAQLPDDTGDADAARKTV